MPTVGTHARALQHTPYHSVFSFVELARVFVCRVCACSSQRNAKRFFFLFNCLLYSSFFVVVACGLCKRELNARARVHAEMLSTRAIWLANSQRDSSDLWRMCVQFFGPSAQRSLSTRARDVCDVWMSRSSSSSSGSRGGACLLIGERAALLGLMAATVSTSNDYEMSRRAARRFFVQSALADEKMVAHESWREKEGRKNKRLPSFINARCGRGGRFNSCFLALHLNKPI